jgi:hypothetical protein
MLTLTKQTFLKFHNLTLELQFVEKSKDNYQVFQVISNNFNSSLLYMTKKSGGEFTLDKVVVDSKTYLEKEINLFFSKKIYGVKLSLLTSYLINDNYVDKVEEFCGLTVYSLSDNEDSLTLFFVKGDKVQKQLNVTAECGQNMGFIDGFEFT